MILKFLTLVSMIPIGIVVLAGQIFGRGRLAACPTDDMGLDVNSLLKRLMVHSQGIELRVNKRVWGLPVVGDELRISQTFADARTTASLGRAVWLVGLAEIASTTPAVLKFWKGARTFGTVAPAFGAMVVIFALFAGRLSVSVGLYIAIIILGLACAFCLMQIVTLRVAAKYGIARLEKAGIFRRLDDEEAVADAARAVAWAEIVPQSLAMVWRQRPPKN